MLSGVFLTVCNKEVSIYTQRDIVSTAESRGLLYVCDVRMFQKSLLHSSDTSKQAAAQLSRVIMMALQFILPGYASYSYVITKSKAVHMFAA